MSNRDQSSTSLHTTRAVPRPVHRSVRPLDGRPRPRTLLGVGDPSSEILDVERPWGGFQQFVCNEQVTVKVITVEPGHRLSLQRHEHRGELWQVIDLPVDVTLGRRHWTALPGEAVWVPQGTVHRLGNSGRLPARVLEIAFGHFDEDDIDRLQDDYDR